MEFNLEYYRAFFFTANFLSVTKAAEQLHLTQPAVSQAIKKLEAALGCKLFVRSFRSLELTKEGEFLYAHVKKAFFELQAGESQLKQLNNLQTGELRLGATESTLRFFLAAQLPQIRAQFPNINISVSGSTTRDTCQKLQNGDIEAAFLLSPLPPEFQFQHIPIREIQDVLLVGKDFPMDLSKTYELSELATYPMIAVADANSVRSYFDRWFLENHMIFQPEYTVMSTGLVLPLVKNNLGIGILPADYLSEAGNEDLCQVKTRVSIPPRAITLAIHPGRSISAVCAKFLELFQS